MHYILLVLLLLVLAYLFTTRVSSENSGNEYRAFPENFYFEPNEIMPSYDPEVYQDSGMSYVGAEQELYE